MNKRYISTDAIVLRSVKSGERDKYIWFLSRDLGKIGSLVRGIKKIGHRYGSCMEIFSEQRIQLYRTKQETRTVLTGAKLLNDHYNLSKDIDRFNQASLVIKIIDTFIVGEERTDSSLFDLLSKTLSSLETERVSSVMSWFFLQFLNRVGYSVSFDRCIVCEDGLSEKKKYVTLSPHDGGIKCDKCGIEKHYSQNIEYNTFRVLTGLSQCDDYDLIKDKCNKLKVEREEAVYKASFKFIDYFSDGKVKLIEN